MESNTYKRFVIMLIISFFIMYGVMFLNVDKLDHIYVSTTRAYMALLMVSPMALLMLTLMGGMYKNKRLNVIISITSVAVFVLALAGLRAQTFIGDKQYMEAMIPHHSSAILTSQEAHITDPEVKKLSEGIIQAQEEEIAQMKNILSRMEKEDK